MKKRRCSVCIELTVFFSSFFRFRISTRRMVRQRTAPHRHADPRRFVVGPVGHGRHREGQRDHVMHLDRPGRNRLTTRHSMAVNRFGNKTTHNKWRKLIEDDETDRNFKHLFNSFDFLWSKAEELDLVCIRHTKSLEHFAAWRKTKWENKQIMKKWVASELTGLDSWTLRYTQPVTRKLRANSAKQGLNKETSTIARSYSMKSIYEIWTLQCSNNFIECFSSYLGHLWLSHCTVLSMHCGDDMIPKHSKMCRISNCCFLLFASAALFGWNLFARAEHPAMHDSSSENVEASKCFEHSLKASDLDEAAMTGHGLFKYANRTVSRGT